MVASNPTENIWGGSARCRLQFWEISSHPEFPLCNLASWLLLCLLPSFPLFPTESCHRFCQFLSSLNNSSENTISHVVYVCVCVQVKGWGEREREEPLSLLGFVEPHIHISYPSNPCEVGSSATGLSSRSSEIYYSYRLKADPSSALNALNWCFFTDLGVWAFPFLSKSFLHYTIFKYFILQFCCLLPELVLLVIFVGE